MARLSPVSASLIPLTSWYLALPVAVFAWTWLSAWLAVIMSLAVGYGLWSLSNSAAKANLPARNWLSIATLAACFTWLGGIGGMVWQRADYLKHALVFGDLTELSWPVVYGEETGFLCYYLAYYLIPSGLAKVFGATTLPFFSFMWSWAGLTMVGGWLVVIWRKPGWVVLPFFFLLGGWDWLGTLIRAGFEVSLYGFSGFYDWLPRETALPMEWNLAHSFPVLYNHYAWAPQHALPAWLGGALLVWVSQQPGRSYSWLPWLNALLLLWSPFLALGIFPFVAWLWLKDGPFSWKKGAAAGLYVLLIALPVLLYFQAHSPLAYAGWAGTYDQHLPGWLLLILAFLLWEVGPVAVMIHHSLQKAYLPASWRPLLWLSGGLLLGIVWFRIGWFNDLVMRVSMVAQLVLFLAFGRAWLHAPRRSRFFRLGLLVFLLGALVPVQEQLKTLVYTYRDTPDFQFAVEENPQLQLPDLDQAYRQAGIPQPFDLAPQYLGRYESFFGRYLMRRPGSISHQHQVNLFQ